MIVRNRLFLLLFSLGFINSIFAANVDITTDTPPNIISDSDTYNFTGDFNLETDASSNLLNTTTTDNNNEGTITLSKTISIIGDLGTITNNLKNLNVTSGTISLFSSAYVSALSISSGANLTTGTITLSSNITNDGTLTLGSSSNTVGNITNNGSLYSYGTITGDITNDNYIALYAGDIIGDVQNNSVLSLNKNGEVQGNISGLGSIFVNDNYNSNGTLTASNVYVSRNATLDLSGGDAYIYSTAILYGANAKIESDENLYINNLNVSANLDEYHDFGIDKDNTVVEITSSKTLTVNSITTPNDTALVNFASTSVADAITNGKIDVSMHYNSASSLSLTNNDARTYDAAGDAIYSEKVVFDELNSMNATQIKVAISTMNPRMEGITTGTINLSSQVLNTVKEYLELAKTNATNKFGQRIRSNDNLWGQVFFNKAQHNGDGDLAGFDNEGSGVVFGLENRNYESDFMNGIAISVAKGDVNSNNSISNASTSIDSLGAVLYGMQDFGSFYVHGSLGYFLNKNSSSRDIIIGSINRTATSNYDSNLLAANVGIGFPLNLYNISVIPKMALNYSSLNIDSYTETGASNLNLTVNPEKFNNISSEFGFDVLKKIYLKDGLLVPKFSAKYVLNSGDEFATTNSFFQGGGDSFKTVALVFDKNYVTLNGGLTYISDNRLSEFSLNYDLAKSSNYKEQRGSFKAQFKF